MAEPTTLQSLEGMIKRLSGENSYTRRKKQKEVVDEETANAQKRFAARLASIRDDDPQREALKKAAFSGGTLFGDWAMKKYKGKKDKEGTTSDAAEYDREKTQWLSSSYKNPEVAKKLSELAPYFEESSSLSSIQNRYNKAIGLGSFAKTTTDENGVATPTSLKYQVGEFSYIRDKLMESGNAEDVYDLDQELKYRVEQEQIRLQEEEKLRIEAENKALMSSFVPDDPKKATTDNILNTQLQRQEEDRKKILQNSSGESSGGGFTGFLKNIFN